MVLYLILPENILDKETNPWLKNGIDEEDILMSQECGILDETYPENDFDKMVRYEEEFLDDYYQFANECEHVFNNPLNMFANEVIDPKKIYSGIEVRITMKKDNFSVGSIDGIQNVYISKNISKQLTIGSIHLMNLIYRPTEKNIWKAIYVYPKIDPIIFSEFSSNGINYKEYHIPKQDIGKMIGKNGICIQKVLNDYTINHKLENIDMNADFVPKIDVYNTCDCTVVKQWDKYELRMNTELKEMNVLEDFLKKMYF